MGEPGTVYHVHNVKGRHNLIMYGWTKPGAHACLSTSIFKTTIVFFLGRYGFSVFVFAVSDI